MTGRRDGLPAAFVGFPPVEGLYAELWLCGISHPAVRTWFGIPGVLALCSAVACRQVWTETAGLGWSGQVSERLCR